VSASQIHLFDAVRVLRRATVPLSLSEIAESLGIAPSSAHAILRVLLSEDVVTRDRDKRYRLGPALFYLGASYARQRPIYRAVWDDLVQLAHDLGLAASVGVTWSNHHLILAVHQNGGPQVGLGIGSRVPIQAGSYGKVYYAWAGVKLASPLKSFTVATITSPAVFRKELKLTQGRGYAIDREEFVAGVGAVAAAVTSSRGYEGVACLMGSIERFREMGYERPGTALVRLSERASVILGDASRQAAWGSTSD
jgi:DNA-binding IclR family transcriptional regulator